MRSWSIWNNFDRFGFGQIESESDSLRNVRTELRVFRHLDVLVGDGLSNYFTVTRLGVARPIFHEGGWHITRFKVVDTEAAKSMEALFLDSEFFENRVKRATKEGRLEKGCPRASPEDEALFPVTNEIAEHGRNRRMRVHLTEGIHRLRSLDSTFPYGLCNRDCDPVEMLHFETEQFACSKAAGCEQKVYDTFLFFGLGDNFGNLFQPFSLDIV